MFFLGLWGVKGQQYDFIYNDLNQLVKNQLPETEVRLPGTDVVTTLRPVISYEYDDLGRKILQEYHSTGMTIMVSVFITFSITCSRDL